MDNKNKISTDNGKLKLSFEEMFCHYSMVFLFSIIPIMTTWYLLEYYFTGTYSGKKGPEELAEIILISLVPVTILYIIQSRGLRFKEVRIRTNETEFQIALKETQKKLKWVIVKNRENFVKAKKKWDWTFSPGEVITIYWYNDKILINSICSLDKPGSLMIMGMNKRNIATFEREIKKASA